MENSLLKKMIQTANANLPKKTTKNDDATPKILKKNIETLEKKMRKAASNLDFEEAAKIRDRINLLKNAILKFS